MKLISMLLVLFLIFLGFFVLFKHKSAVLHRWTSMSQAKHVNSELGYIAVDPINFGVTLFADKIASPTRIKITPDGKYLLVAEISGQVLAFNQNGNGWDKVSHPLVQVETHFPGFPPEEGGLVGMVFSADFTNNGKLFLLYSFKDKNGKIFNRVSVSTLTIKNGNLTASLPKQIFQANVTGSDSHQITDGIGVKIDGQPMLLFLIGEGFGTNAAQNPREESGKVMLISEDGSNPLGQRPYAENPKVQAIGLRNAYVLAQNTYENQDQNKQRVLIMDTGPNHFDRVIDLYLYNSLGTKIKPINLGWDGIEDDLQKPIPDPNLLEVKDIVILRLPETLTFTGLAFHPGKGAIPKSTNETQSVLMTLYGKTGSTDNGPGKEVWLGLLTSSAAGPKLTSTPIVKRNPNAAGKLGNPIGLEVDLQTGNFFFADVVEGKVYQVSVK